MPEDRRVKREFLLLLLQEIQVNGANLKLISKNLDMSKQALNYHLRKLSRMHFIERRQKHPYAIYVLTPMGNRVKEMVGQSEDVRPLWRVHALIVGFEILNYGNFEWSNYKKKQMNNWHYVEEEIKDDIGIWKIHIQSTGLVKIYCPEIYTPDPNVAFGALYDVASRLARKYEEIYDMKIGLMKTIREGHKELVNSEKLANLLGKTKIGKVWADASTGSRWLEESQSSEGIENVLAMPSKIEQLEGHLVKQTEIMDKFTEQMALHLSVLEEMKATLKKIGGVLDDRNNRSD